MSSSHGPHIAALIVACATLCVSPLRANEEAEVTKLASENAALRRQVDEASAGLRRARERAEVTEEALVVEREQLVLQAERAEARRRALREVVAARRAEVRAREEGAAALEGPLLGACAELVRAIEETGPLERRARAERVRSIEERLRAGALTPRAALEELAAVVDDELELAHTIQLTRHVIELDGAPRRVPVVALGAALMYWRTEEGGAGMLAKVDGEWERVEARGEEEREAIGALHDAARSASRGAILTLPLPRPAARERGEE
jgi:hypothetical protein